MFEFAQSFSDPKALNVDSTARSSIWRDSRLQIRIMFDPAKSNNEPQTPVTVAALRGFEKAGGFP